jgi:hypothetical protein
VPVDEEVMQTINLTTHAIIVHEYLLSPARHVATALRSHCFAFALRSHCFAFALPLPHSCS